jgi:hypothetical protein
MSIISRVTRTTVTTETVEDTTPDFAVRSFTPDYGFNAPDYSGYDDTSNDYDTELADDDANLDDWLNSAARVDEDASTQQALTVAVQLDGVPSGTFTYPSIKRFSAAVESYGSYYSSAGEVTLTIRKS